MTRRLKPSDVQAILNERYQNKYNVIEVIDSGAFATVFLGLTIKYKIKVAIKVVDKEKLNCQQLRDMALQEVEVIKKLQYLPAATKIYDNAETDEYIIIVLEFCPMTLTQLIDDFFPLGIVSGKIVLQFIFQINQLLKMLHIDKYIHRDIKPQNILVSITDNLLDQLDSKSNRIRVLEDNLNQIQFKLIDFGITKKVKREQDFKTGTMAGSSSTMAPEIVNRKDYDYAVDVYSLGVCAQYMLSKKYERKAQPRILDDNLKLLLPYMLVEDPMNRINSRQLESILIDILDGKPISERKINELKGIYPRSRSQIRIEQQSNETGNSSQTSNEKRTVSLEKSKIRIAESPMQVTNNRDNNQTTQNLINQQTPPNTNAQEVKINPQTLPSPQHNNPTPSQKFQQTSTNKNPAQFQVTGASGPGMNTMTPIATSQPNNQRTNAHQNIPAVGKTSFRSTNQNKYQ